MSKQSMISIVDDDQPFRESLGRLLRSLGYAVSVFPSPIEFLASPRITTTACLIADVHMPEISGIELYQQLVKSDRVIPTILVTAYPDDVVEKQMLATGVECYLRKPLEEAHLIKCLRAIFERGKNR